MTRVSQLIHLLRLLHLKINFIFIIMSYLIFTQTMVSWNNACLSRPSGLPKRQIVFLESSSRRMHTLFQHSCVRLFQMYKQESIKSSCIVIWGFHESSFKKKSDLPRNNRYRSIKNHIDKNLIRLQHGL